VGDGVTIARVYESAAMSALFTPAATIEGWLTGCNVIATHYYD
jgi:hypothetical protein